MLTAFEGDLYPGGRAQSVFSLETDTMDQVMQEDGSATRLLVRPGEVVELPGARGTLELESVVRWGGLLVRHDPGRIPALVSAAAAMAGLMLMLGVRRRRVFVQVDAPAGERRHTGITVAALPKGTDPGLEDLAEQVLDQIVDAAGGRATQKDGTV